MLDLARAPDSLYDTYRPAVLAFVRRRVRDRAEAEDVTQEVFLTVHRKLHCFEGRSPLSAWIYGIAYHEVGRYYRSRRRLRATPVARLPEVAADGVAPDEWAESARVLGRCRAAAESRLTPLQRRVFELYYGENRSTPEIAGELGSSAQAVRLALSRGRRSLRRSAAGLEAVLGP